MEKLYRIASLFVFLLVVSIFGIFVSADSEEDTLALEVSLLGPAEDVISISVTDYFYLGNVSKGGEVRNNQGDIRINNTGNVPVIVGVELPSGYDPIFDNLYFSTYATSSYKLPSDFYINLSAPPSSGWYKNIYAKLDLKNYTGTLPTGVNNKLINVKFIAVKQ